MVLGAVRQAYEKHPPTLRQARTGSEEPYVSRHRGRSLSLSAAGPARLSELAQIPSDMLAPAPSSPLASSVAIKDVSRAAPLRAGEAAPALAAAAGKKSGASPASVQGWLGHYAQVDSARLSGSLGGTDGDAATQLRRELKSKMRVAAAAARLLRKAAADPRDGSAARAAAEVLARRTEQLRMEAHSVAAREENRRAELGDLWDQGDSTL